MLTYLAFSAPTKKARVKISAAGPILLIILKNRKRLKFLQNAENKSDS